MRLAHFVTMKRQTPLYGQQLVIRGKELEEGMCRRRRNEPGEGRVQTGERECVKRRECETERESEGVTDCDTGFHSRCVLKGSSGSRRVSMPMSIFVSDC